MTNSNKKKWGGSRVNAGRKKKTENVILEELNEEIKNHKSKLVDVTNISQEGREKIEKKERLLIVLEVLFQEACLRKNISAAKEWLDRTMGKAPQTLEHSENTSPIEQRVPTKAEQRAANAYYDELQKYNKEN